jgi:hypothetical protein
MLDMDAPRANRVEVCHAYTCQRKTPYGFTSANITEITSLMRKIKRNDSPAEERRAIAYAIGLMERQVGVVLGIRDKAGMRWTASGDPTAYLQNCGFLIRGACSVAPAKSVDSPLNLIIASQHP